MTEDRIRALFTRADGTCLFARWGRPTVHVVIGVADAALATMKGAFQAIAHFSGHPMADTDPAPALRLAAGLSRAGSS